MKGFPFPDQVESRRELERDILFDKIPPEHRVIISDNAWKTGVEAAHDLFLKYDKKITMEQIANKSGLIVERQYKDQVIAGQRYFAEYYSGRNRIILYTESIGKWARENLLASILAEELILAHEFYHFLECTKLGLTSKQYLVPVLKIGSLVLVRSGVRTLSEIGAHGFSRTFYELRGSITSR